MTLYPHQLHGCQILRLHHLLQSPLLLFPIVLGEYLFERVESDSIDFETRKRDVNVLLQR